MELQALIFEEHGAPANDLEDGDAGTGSDRVVRKRRVAREEEATEGGAAKKKKSKKQKTREIIELHGYEWYEDETFEIDRLLDKKVEELLVGKSGRKRKAEYIYYKVLWKGYPPEVATWEHCSGVHDDFIDEYEAKVEADAELDEEQRARDQEDASDGEEDAMEQS